MEFFLLSPGCECGADDVRFLLCRFGTDFLLLMKNKTKLFTSGGFMPKCKVCDRRIVGKTTDFDGAYSMLHGFLIK